jgi:hypothetical protein
MKSIRIPVLLTVSLIAYGTLRADEDLSVFRIAVLDETRHGGLSTDTHPFFGDLRDYLNSGAGFSRSFELVPYPAFDPGSLTGEGRPDLIMVHNGGPMAPPLGVPEQEELLHYVEDGGPLFIMIDLHGDDIQDAVTAGNAFLAPFGLLVAGLDPICDGFAPVEAPEGHPLTDGPFGVVDHLLLGGAGWLEDLGPHAQALVGHPQTEEPANGQPVVAVIERDTLEPGSGRVLVASDGNWLLDSDLSPDFHFSRNERLFSNALAWLAERCTPELVATREISATASGTGDGFRPGESFQVRVHLEPYALADDSCTPDRDDMDAAIELREILPPGWTVEAGSISDGGNSVEFEGRTTVHFSALEQRTEPFVVSYTAIAGDILEEASFAGELELSTSSVQAVVRGDRTVRVRQRVLRIATLDESRNDHWGFNKSLLFRDMRQTIATRAAELGFDRIDLIPVRELTETTLADAHLIMLNSRASNLGECPDTFEFSSGEQDVLLDFIRAGGGALVLLESGQYPGSQLLLDPFEVQIENDTWFETDTNPVADPDAHPITSGPFGTITHVRSDFSGWFPDLGPHATPLVELTPVGQPFLATIERNALGTGSGPVLLSADLNWLADLPVGHGEEPYFFFRDSPHEELFLNAISWLSEDLRATEFLRGDCNDDGAVDISDAVCILGWLFLGDAQPACLSATNTNGDAGGDLSDAVYLLNHLFLGGPPPPGPFPECGPPSYGEALACETPPANCP